MNYSMRHYQEKEKLYIIEKDKDKKKESCIILFLMGQNMKEIYIQIKYQEKEIIIFLIEQIYWSFVK